MSSPVSATGGGAAVYRAPDGACFTSVEAYRSHMRSHYYSCTHVASDMVMKYPGELAGQAFDISDVTDVCCVLADYTSQVTVTRAVGCRMFIGPCAGAVFLTDCTDCVLTVACNQLRLRGCSNIILCGHVRAEPTLDHCTDIVFGQYNGVYATLTEQFRIAGLNPEVNSLFRVNDFSASDASLPPPPHWRKLDLQDWSTIVHEVAQSPPADMSKSTSGGGAVGGTQPPALAEVVRLSPAAQLAVAALLDRYDTDGDGAWDFHELNAYQAATGDDDRVADAADMQRMFAAAGIALDASNRLRFSGLLQLYSVQGADALVRDLEAIDAKELAPGLLPLWRINTRPRVSTPLADVSNRTAPGASTSTRSMLPSRLPSLSSAARSRAADASAASPPVSSTGGAGSGRTPSAVAVHARPSAPLVPSVIPAPLPLNVPPPQAVPSIAARASGAPSSAAAPPPASPTHSAPPSSLLRPPSTAPSVQGTAPQTAVSGARAVGASTSRATTAAPLSPPREAQSARADAAATTRPASPSARCSSPAAGRAAVSPTRGAAASLTAVAASTRTPSPPRRRPLEEAGTAAPTPSLQTVSYVCVAAAGLHRVDINRWLAQYDMTTDGVPTGLIQAADLKNALVALLQKYDIWPPYVQDAAGAVHTEIDTFLRSPASALCRASAPLSASALNAKGVAVKYQVLTAAILPVAARAPPQVPLSHVGEGIIPGAAAAGSAMPARPPPPPARVVGGSSAPPPSRPPVPPRVGSSDATAGLRRPSLGRRGQEGGESELDTATDRAPSGNGHAGPRASSPSMRTVAGAALRRSMSQDREGSIRVAAPRRASMCSSAGSEATSVRSTASDTLNLAAASFLADRYLASPSGAGDKPARSASPALRGTLHRADVWNEHGDASGAGRREGSVRSVGTNRNKGVASNRAILSRARQRARFMDAGDVEGLSNMLLQELRDAVSKRPDAYASLRKGLAYATTYILQDDATGSGSSLSRSTAEDEQAVQYVKVGTVTQLLEAVGIRYPLPVVAVALLQLGGTLTLPPDIAHELAQLRTHRARSEGSEPVVSDRAALAVTEHKNVVISVQALRNYIRQQHMQGRASAISSHEWKAAKAQAEGARKRVCLEWFRAALADSTSIPAFAVAALKQAAQQAGHMRGRTIERSGGANSARTDWLQRADILALLEKQEIIPGEWLQFEAAAAAVAWLGGAAGKAAVTKKLLHLPRSGGALAEDAVASVTMDVLACKTAEEAALLMSEPLRSLQLFEEYARDSIAGAWLRVETDADGEPIVSYKADERLLEELPMTDSVAKCPRGFVAWLRWREARRAQKASVLQSWYMVKSQEHAQAAAAAREAVPVEVIRKVVHTLEQRARAEVYEGGLAAPLPPSADAGGIGAAADGSALPRARSTSAHSQTRGVGQVKAMHPSRQGLDLNQRMYRLLQLADAPDAQKQRLVLLGATQELSASPVERLSAVAPITSGRVVTKKLVQQVLGAPLRSLTADARVSRAARVLDGSLHEVARRNVELRLSESSVAGDAYRARLCDIYEALVASHASAVRTALAASRDTENVLTERVLRSARASGASYASDSSQAPVMGMMNLAVESFMSVQQQAAALPGVSPPLSPVSCASSVHDQSKMPAAVGDSEQALRVVAPAPGPAPDAAQIGTPSVVTSQVMQEESGGSAAARPPTSGRPPSVPPSTSQSVVGSRRSSGAQPLATAPFGGSGSAAPSVVPSPSQLGSVRGDAATGWDDEATDEELLGTVRCELLMEAAHGKLVQEEVSRLQARDAPEGLHFFADSEQAMAAALTEATDKRRVVQEGYQEWLAAKESARQQARQEAAERERLAATRKLTKQQHAEAAYAQWLADARARYGYAHGNRGAPKHDAQLDSYAHDSWAAVALSSTSLPSSATSKAASGLPDASLAEADRAAETHAVRQRQVHSPKSPASVRPVRVASHELTALHGQKLQQQQQQRTPTRRGGERRVESEVCAAPSPHTVRSSAGAATGNVSIRSVGTAQSPYATATRRVGAGHRAVHVPSSRQPVAHGVAVRRGGAVPRTTHVRAQAHAPKAHHASSRGFAPQAQRAVVPSNRSATGGRTSFAGGGAPGRSGIRGPPNVAGFAREDEVLLPRRVGSQHSGAGISSHSSLHRDRASFDMGDDGATQLSTLERSQASGSMVRSDAGWSRLFAEDDPLFVHRGPAHARAYETAQGRGGSMEEEDAAAAAAGLTRVGEEEEEDEWLPEHEDVEQRSAFAPNSPDRYSAPHSAYSDERYGVLHDTLGDASADGSDGSDSGARVFPTTRAARVPAGASYENESYGSEDDGGWDEGAEAREAVAPRRHHDEDAAHAAVTPVAVARLKREAAVADATAQLYMRSVR